MNQKCIVKGYRKCGESDAEMHRTHIQPTKAAELRAFNSDWHVLHKQKKKTRGDGSAYSLSFWPTIIGSWCLGCEYHVTDSIQPSFPIKTEVLFFDLFSVAASFFVHYFYVLFYWITVVAYFFWTFNVRFIFKETAKIGILLQGTNSIALCTLCKRIAFWVVQMINETFEGGKSLDL